MPFSSHKQNIRKRKTADVFEALRTIDRNVSAKESSCKVEQPCYDRYSFW